MTPKTLIRLLLTVAFLGSPLTEATARPRLPNGRQVAITFDDLPTLPRAFPEAQKCDFEAIQRSMANLTSVIRKHKIPVVGFVNEGRRCENWTPDQLTTLLEMWLDAGAELGNHTYSHPDLYAVSLNDFKADILRGEPITRNLLEARGRELRYFRHPFLHTGKEESVRADLNRFLTARGYTTAPITLDAQDWLFGRVYSWAEESGDLGRRKRAVDSYLVYLEALIEHFEARSIETLGYQVRQTLLLHSSALNHDHFEEVVKVFKRRGYKFITLAEALADEPYSEDVPPKGSWINGWAAKRGLPDVADPAPAPYLGSLFEDYELVVNAVSRDRDAKARENDRLGDLERTVGRLTVENDSLRQRIVELEKR